MTVPTSCSAARDRSVLRVHDQSPCEQGVEASRTRAADATRGTALRDLLLHRRRPDWKQISTWAAHGDVRQTWNRYGHLVRAAKTRRGSGSTPSSRPHNRSRLWAHTVAHDPKNDETPPPPGF